MTLKNNRAPLLGNVKLCASFHHHMWIQTGVMVRKQLSWVLTSVTLTYDLWPWPFEWASLVITPENFMMIRWWEHSQKGVTDRWSDGQTDGLNHSYSCLVAAEKCYLWYHYSKVLIACMITGECVIYTKAKTKWLSFANNIFKCIFLNLDWNLLNFVSRSPIYHKPAMV